MNDGGMNQGVEEQGETVVSKTDKVMNKYTLMAYSLNYVFGAGVLSIPYAFVHGGILASAITLLVSSMFSLVTVLWLFEIQTRAQELDSRWFFNQHRRDTEIRDISARKKHPQLSRESPELPLTMMRNLSFQLTELCSMFLGRFGSRIYDLSLLIFVISAAWMYASIFASSMLRVAVEIGEKDLKLFNATQLSTAGIPSLFTEDSDEEKVSFSCDLTTINGPLFQMPTKLLPCYAGYLFFILLFFGVQYNLLKLGVLKISRIQMTMTAIGLFGLLLMIFWCFQIIITNGMAELSLKEALFSPKDYGRVFSSFAFAQMLHMAIPMLCDMSPTNEKKDVYETVKSTLTVTTTLYLLLGLSAALAFGNGIEKVVTLNWGKQSVIGSSWKLRYLGYLVQLYPCVTCSAAFPLYIFSLVDNFSPKLQKKEEDEEKMKTKSEISVDSFNQSNSSVDSTLHMNELEEPLLSTVDGEKNKKDALATEEEPAPRAPLRYYLWCATLPICLAGFVADVKFILVFIGLAGFFISFIIPSLLHISSRRFCDQEWGSYIPTVFDSRISYLAYAFIALLFGIVTCTYSTYSTIADALG